ncbi:hypothetical protein BJY04DRAFT_220167 [Aspergillus karnatakaensis]|uniref:uncharacterized protein n=1 Tax=Aspergillus karnatakaensis TaxID=1810916 RepID=UPI003CCD2C47
MDTASIARDFVVEKGPIYHHSFSVPSIFDQQRCEFAPHSPHADLKEVLRDCAQTRKVTWNIDNCTWDDVFHELQAAEDEYNRRGVKNPVRRLMRAAGEHAADISRWFDLFPSESGGSMVSGGLKLVFSLVKHQVEIRNKILVAFSEILETVAYTRLTRELFRTDSRAMTCARALYEAVLRTITDLILMLNGSQTSKSNARHLLSKVTKPLKRSDEVDRLLEDMNSKGRQYQNCLAIAQMERDKRIDTTTRAALSEIQSTRETVTDTRGGVMAVNDKVNQIHARLGEMQDMFQPTQITLGCSAQNALLNTALDILHEVRGKYT